MINWNDLHITIDNQAKIQIDRYFQDLQKILEDQNLFDKKEEVFHDLENHIIDHVTNHNLKTITFQDALNIIGELGPPDEYKDFSTMPGILDVINKKTNTLKVIPNFDNEFVLCDNCNTKNEKSSIFCIICGKKLTAKNKYVNEFPIKYLFKNRTTYFFNSITITLLALLSLFENLFPYDPNTIMYTFIIPALQFLISLNEILIIPLIFIYNSKHLGKSASVIIDYVLGVLTKVSCILIPIFLLIILRIIGFSQNYFLLFALIMAIMSISLFILFTRFLFFSSFSEYIYRIDFVLISKAFYFLNLIFVILIALTEYQAMYLSGGDFVYTLTFLTILGIESLFLIVQNKGKPYSADALEVKGLQKESSQKLSEKEFNSNKITLKSIKEIFLSNLAYFYSLLSFFILSVYFLVVQSFQIFSFASFILEIFMINELVAIPIFFIYQLLNKNSTRFEFLAFFYSYLAKYVSLLLLMICTVGLIVFFGISYSLSELICSFLLILLPVVFTNELFYSKYTINLQKVLNNKPKRNNILTYCLVYLGVLISMACLLFVVNTSIPWTVILILFSIILLIS